MAVEIPDVAGPAQHLPGESGTLYTLDLAGKPLLAEVTNYPGAEEFAQHVEVSP